MNKLLKMYICLFVISLMIVNKSCGCYISYTGAKDHLKEGECRQMEGEGRKEGENGERENRERGRVNGERGREKGEKGREKGERDPLYPVPPV